MAVTNRRAAERDDAPRAAAAAVRSADLVHIAAVADGDCLCAAGLLARACVAEGIPYHVSAGRTAAELDAQLDGVDASAASIAIGASPDGALVLDAAGPVSPLAYAVAAALDASPDPVAALAGVVASGAAPDRAAPDLLDAAGIDRTPGVATPTTDLVDGLAYSGLVHAGFSGDAERARDALATIGLADADARAVQSDDSRRLASLLALAAAGDPAATSRAGTAVERALRPYATDGPFATLAGHADVLSALAERAPGLAVAHHLGEDGREAALAAWRDHGQALHAGVRSAETARYTGLLVARTDGPVAGVARLLRDFRSPEPVVLAVGDGEAAVASVDADIAGQLAAAAEAGAGSSIVRGPRGYATFDAARTEQVVAAFREAR